MLTILSPSSHKTGGKQKETFLLPDAIPQLLALTLPISTSRQAMTITCRKRDVVKKKKDQLRKINMLRKAGLEGSFLEQFSEVIR